MSLWQHCPKLSFWRPTPFDTRLDNTRCQTFELPILRKALGRLGNNSPRLHQFSPLYSFTGTFGAGQLAGGENRAVSKTIDREAFTAKLRREYAESAGDRLERLDELIDRLYMGAGTDADVSEIQREVHSLKGSAGTFGFPAVTAVAHRMEDYIETSQTFDGAHLNALQAYMDAVRSLIGAEREPDSEALRKLLEDLPSNARPDRLSQGFTGQKVKEIHTLLVMPRGIQRKIIGTELTSCGFRVSVADQGIDAIARALVEPPDIVLTAMELSDMSGGELTQVFLALERLRASRLIVLTSYDATAPKVRALPDGVAVVRKGEPFIEDLSRCLIEWRILS